MIVCFVCVEDVPLIDLSRRQTQSLTLSCSSTYQSTSCARSTTTSTTSMTFGVCLGCVAR